METTKVITPYFENGVFAGVRVTSEDEDFVIARKDYQDGKEMSWRAAMDTLKAEKLKKYYSDDKQADIAVQDILNSI